MVQTMKFYQVVRAYESGSEVHEGFFGARIEAEVYIADFDWSGVTAELLVYACTFGQPREVLSRHRDPSE